MTTLWLRDFEFLFSIVFFEAGAAQLPGIRLKVVVQFLGSTIPQGKELRLLGGVGFTVSRKEAKSDGDGAAEGTKTTASDAGTGHQLKIRQLGNAFRSFLTPCSVI